MQALLLESPGRVNLKTIATPDIGPDEALVEVRACGLCGTDLVKILNENLKIPPKVPIGHEVAGQVAQLGRKVKKFKVGQRVVVAHHVPCFDCHYCRRGSHSMCREFKATNIDPGGFSQYIRVSAKHLDQTVLPIPAGLDDAIASQTEPLACCVRNARRLSAGPGDTIVVVGLGAIGLMMAQVLAARKTDVVGVDVDSSRIAVAKSLGIARAITGNEDDIRKTVFEASRGRGADAVIFTAGTPSLIESYVNILRDGGAISVLASFHPDPILKLDLNAVYHREITVMSSYSAAPEDLREALKLISSGKVSVRHYVDSLFRLDQFDAAVEQVRKRQILKAIFLPQAIMARSAEDRAGAARSYTRGTAGKDAKPSPAGARADRSPVETAS